MLKIDKNRTSLRNISNTATPIWKILSHLKSRSQELFNELLHGYFGQLSLSWRTLTLMTSWPWNLVYFDWLSKDYLVFRLQLHRSIGYCTNQHYWEEIVIDFDLYNYILVFHQVLSCGVLLQIFFHCKVVSHHYSMRKIYDMTS